MNKNHVTLNGIELSYYYHFIGKPCILFIHGLTDSGLYWQRVVEKLQNQFDIVAPDLRGHGFSSKPSSGYSYDDFVGDISSFLRILNLRNVTIVGHSIGADIAMLLASQSKDLVSGVVMEDPPWEDPFPTVEKKNQEAWSLRNELLQYSNKSVEELEEYFIATTSNVNLIDAKTWARSQKMVSASVVEWVTSKPANWRIVLPKIDCNILLITGENNLGAYVTPRLAQEAQNLWHKGTHINIRNSGHTIHRDQFERFVKVLQDFLHMTHGKTV